MRMTTEEAFVKVLQMHGIEHAFGIIGSAFMPISDLFPKAEDAPKNQYRAALVEVKEPNSYPYFLALQQDYEQMPRQQRGLRNLKGEHMTLVMEEINVARFHTVLDRWLNREV